MHGLILPAQLWTKYFLVTSLFNIEDCSKIHFSSSIDVLDVLDVTWPSHGHRNTTLSNGLTSEQFVDSKPIPSVLEEAQVVLASSVNDMESTGMPKRYFPGPGGIFFNWAHILVLRKKLDLCTQGSSF